MPGCLGAGMGEPGREAEGDDSPFPKTGVCGSHQRADRTTVFLEQHSGSVYGSFLWDKQGVGSRAAGLRGGEARKETAAKHCVGAGPGSLGGRGWALGSMCWGTVPSDNEEVRKSHGRTGKGLEGVASGGRDQGEWTPQEGALVADCPDSSLHSGHS